MISVAEKRDLVAMKPVNAVLLAGGVLGFSYATTQLALMRELLVAFSGNEMVLGFVLGGWLLLMGIGTLAGRVSDRLSQPLVWLSVCLVVLALVPPIQVFVLRWLRNVIFTRGAEVEPAQTLCSVLVVLLPYCVPGGLALALTSASLLASNGANAVSRIYTADAIGSVAGGLLFSLVLVHFMDHIALLLFPAAANLLMAGALAWYSNRPGLAYVSVTLAVTLPLVGILGHADSVSTQLQYEGQQVLAYAQSEYGNLVLLKADEQLNVLQNNVPIGSSRDNFHSEETVHYAMSQRPDARQVLLAGGCLSGSPAEVLKYSGLERIDCIEMDPAVFRLSGQLMPGKPPDSRIRFVLSDPRTFLSQGLSNHAYDVIILDVPPPSTAALNRFFTVEFFRQIRKILSPDGVLAFSLGEYANYVSPEFARVLSSARATVASQFQNVKLVPGARVLFLASAGPLFEDIASRMETNAVRVAMLKRSYLKSQLAPDRFQDLSRAAAMAAPLNHDFSPVLYFLHLRHWLSRFDWRVGFACGAAALALLCYLAYLVWHRPTALVMFGAGFAGTTLQIVLLLAYQILCGSVYYQLGIIISLFMAGLALGAWFATRGFFPTGSLFRNDSVVLVWLAALIVVFALFLPYNLRAFGSWSGPVASVSGPKVAIGLFAFALAALLGAQFTVANRIDYDSTAGPASRLYAADFLGSFTGAVIACTILIPLLGVAVACYLTAALNLITAGIFSFRARSA
jgi:spermidine synthase